MSLFWRPHGMPINVKELKDGQHVEGYIKPRYDSFRKQIKDGVIRIEDNGPNAMYEREIFLLYPGAMSKKRIGYFYARGTFGQDYDYQLRLYDGFRFEKPKRKRSLLP